MIPKFKFTSGIAHNQAVHMVKLLIWHEFEDILKESIWKSMAYNLQDCLGHFLEMFCISRSLFCWEMVKETVLAQWER